VIDQPVLLFIGVPAAALLIFWVRHRWARVCGVVEIGIGFLLIKLAYSVAGSLSRDFSADFDVVRTVVQWSSLIGAVLVMADGLSRFFPSCGERDLP
jgi:hypothetical protein